MLIDHILTLENSNKKVEVESTSFNEVVLFAGRDAAMIIDVHLARGVKLRDDVLGVLVLRGHAVELGELRLRLLQPGQSILDVLLLQDGLLFVGLHLGLCPPPLRADLEHVCGRTFVDYHKTKMMSKRRGIGYLRDTAVLAANAAATSGSSSIKRSPFCATCSFRASI